MPLSHDTGSIKRVETEEEASRLVGAKEPFIFSGGEVLDIRHFVERFGDAPVRISVEEFLLPSSATMLSVRKYEDACKGWVALPWSLDSDKLPYAFHDVTGHDMRNQRVAMRGGPSANEEDPLSDFVLGAPLPDFFKRLSRTFACVAARVALGPEHTYANIHYHGVALNQLLHGEKFWRIYHPYIADYLFQMAEGLRVPNKFLFFEKEIVPLALENTGDISELMLRKHREWHEKGICSAPVEGDPLWEAPLAAELVRGIAFSQLPGDTVYLPPGWGHAVENRSWTLCRIFELDRPSEKTKRKFRARGLDERGALISMKTDCRLSTAGGEVAVETTTSAQVDRIALEVAAQVDGLSTAREVAGRCSDPEAALSLLEELHDLLFTRSTPQTTLNVADWEDKYSSGAYAEEWESGTPAMSTVAFLSSATIPDGSHVLDVGCGAGTDAIYMAGLGYKVHGIDLSRKAIRIAQIAAEASRVDVDFKCESVTAMSLRDSSVAAVFDRGCLHSLPSEVWPAYFAEIDRVLEGNGWLVITGSNEARGSYFTPILRELLVPFEGKFAVSRFESTSMATALGHMPAAFVLMRSKKKGPG